MEDESQSHIGFVVYDPIKKKQRIAFNEHTHFTPASNVKILTLYGSLRILKDTIPALRYIKKQDSLIFWGTGDPSFLYAQLPPNSNVFNFLKNTPSSLYFSTTNFHADYFGAGWAWDDYQYSFSSERSPFPLYGNRVTFAEDKENQLHISPAYFKHTVAIKNDTTAKKEITREVGSNQFVFCRGASALPDTTKIPFHTSPLLTARLLSDTLQKEVTLMQYPLPSQTETLYSIPADTLYRLMMQESDNFVAEQLLLMCAGAVSDTLNSTTAIAYIKKKYLFDLSDEIKWVDGSGLSRYNLLTPQTIVQLWEKISTVIPQKRLFQLLAVGGQSGTLKKRYRKEPPYIYGKSGTLSNNYCLSGYLVTKKRKILLFSFMNNNYTVSKQKTHLAIEKLLKEIYEKF